MASIKIHGAYGSDKFVICPKKKTWKEQKLTKCSQCEYYRSQYGSIIICHYGEVKGWETHISYGNFGP